MTGAPQFRDRMAAYLRGEASAAAVSLVESPAQGERLKVYRNNFIKAGVDALMAAYPGVAAFVGEDFFRAVARDFVAAFPPADRTLSLYGAEFPGYLGGHEAVRSLPYLSAVARLDRAWLEVHLEADADPVTGAELNAWMAAGGDIETAQFSLVPAARFIELPWTVVASWIDCRDGKAPQARVEIEQAPDHALIWRYEDVVRYRRLKHGEAVFVGAIGADVPLGAAAERAMEVQADFDVGPTLAGALDAGVFLGPVMAAGGKR